MVAFHISNLLLQQQNVTSLLIFFLNILPKNKLTTWSPHWMLAIPDVCLLSVYLTVNFDHFQILRAIGKGSFGKVSVTHRSLIFRLKEPFRRSSCNQLVFSS